MILVRHRKLKKHFGTRYARYAVRRAKKMRVGRK